MIHVVSGLVRLALIAACLLAVIWAVGHLSVQNLISFGRSYLRLMDHFRSWLDHLAHVKGMP